MNSHINEANMDDELHLAGVSAEQLAGDSPPPPLPGDLALQSATNLALLLDIATDSAETWKRHLAGLVAMWDSLGVYGFVCKDQTKLPEFLAKMHEVKSILRG